MPNVRVVFEGAAEGDLVLWRTKVYRVTNKGRDHLELLREGKKYRLYAHHIDGAEPLLEITDEQKETEE